MKLTQKNIIDLWFGADTPIRQFKIKMNPQLWAACLKVNHYFKPPSGRAHTEQYRKSDKVAFAESVLNELRQTPVFDDSTVHDMM